MELRDAAKERLLKALKNDVQEYRIGSKTVKRYDLELEAMRETVAYYDGLIDEIDAELDGAGARRAIAVLERDW